MADYKFYKNIPGTAKAGVIYNSKQSIPLDPDNTDYHEYLERVDAGITTEDDDY